ncbi:DNA repair protein RecO [Candidatus Daviesbacteria bacterium RIFCSPLOWO2_02_FULL_38_18]|uniref:DNA repair protein RecO n=1 Tax=Candidatus Daviesbacteria bacterium GW2011_GWF2_38_6 TaxID=1618432 RepID=A0A0G0KT44_9BACT|nr:MAG: repair protein RecO protein [Candidatus Daviesbacteria bacterium GW2011_GWA2_38_17]KKQ78680.1 MAG: repair protein RecO protein [Candidatus Daviesbacteria bacterium GW2011_GWF2_38_6]OGE44579.1 MAG: DNA repair protein RecO [Candidatus Daviesbacteria bacterium RIFCSPHIGHO2_12_FULL_38_25]OGE68875.1 MAG: DNA repair protein RecO [Candidatus Daviesbacteria bacterium RIFCSPLOWO2_02_FULL_38_18]OGE73301.1 MAG: DNA repair protein RecO [Candidatus Daviesbacteria bacterium RIFCSPLOWO2_12_FULL_38_10]
MLGFKTEGIILKRRDFGEADRILTVFSLHRGKITVLAKGVRRITSRRGGNVELLNRVQMFLYPGKNFLILTEAISLDTFQKLKEDLILSTYAFHILELVNKLTAENQENRDLYSHLVEVLKRLSRKPRQILIRAFEVKILSNLGFAAFRASTSKVSAQLETGSWDEIEKMEIQEKQALELEQTLRYTIERVIEGKLKSRQFLKKI